MGQSATLVNAESPRLLLPAYRIKMYAQHQNQACHIAIFVTASCLRANAASGTGETVTE